MVSELMCSGSRLEAIDASTADRVVFNIASSIFSKVQHGNACSEMPPIDDSFHMAMEIQPLPSSSAGQPVAEGFLSRKKAPEAASGAAAPAITGEGHSGETETTVVSTAKAPRNAVNNHLLRKQRPKEDKMPKFKTPNVTRVRPRRRVMSRAYQQSVFATSTYHCSNQEICLGSCSFNLSIHDRSRNQYIVNVTGPCFE
jgi:hypothetical protein